MSEIRPYTINVADEEIEKLKSKLEISRFPEKETTGDWSQGVPLAYMKNMTDYWLKKYDFKRLETRLNRYENLVTEIDGVDIHFMHIKSSNANAKPLLLTHGWPGSVVEFLKVIEGLTEPQSVGGSADDAFHLVIPSLPGFGFSGKPTSTGWGVDKIATAWVTLMGRLGYDSYFAQGGDWGALVTSWVARHDKNCKGIHLNMVVVPPDSNATDLTDIEKKALEGWQYYQDWDSGYSKQQSTRPQSIGYGLVDSPVGLAAWIIEKYWAWTDSNGDPENVLTKDEMLDNIMVYWLNAAGASSARIYWESFGGGLGAEPITTPMGGTDFPREIFRTSERFAKKFYTGLFYWSVRQSGGHFAAFEQPSVYVEEIQACFRQIR